MTIIQKTLNPFIPSIVDRFVGRIKIDRMLKQTKPWEKIMAVTEPRHGITLFLSAGYVYSYDYMDVIAADIAPVPFPNLKDAVTDLCESAIDVLAQEWEGMSQIIAEGNLHSRCARLTAPVNGRDGRIFVVAGVTGKDVLQEAIDNYKISFGLFAPYDQQAHDEAKRVPRTTEGPEATPNP
jgi:hypothetical protein